MPELHLAPGQTFDLRADRNGRSWNFLLTADRAEARRVIQEAEPYIVIGSPPCTSFCSFNRRLNYRRMDPDRVRRLIHEGNVLLKFAIEIYEFQLAAGRHFLHEHLASACSWQVPRMAALRGHSASVSIRRCDTGSRWQANASSEADTLPELRTRAPAVAWKAVSWRIRAPTAHEW